jgi:hypothetical protein
MERLGGAEFEGWKPLVIFGRRRPSKEFASHLEEKGIRRAIGRGKVPTPEQTLWEAEARIYRFQGEPDTGNSVSAKSGKREALRTNLEKGKTGEEAVSELYCERRTIGTKHNRERWKLKMDLSSGWQADNIKRDFHAMMTVASLPAGALRDAGMIPVWAWA